MPSINPSATYKRTALVLLNTVLGEMGMPAISSVNSTDDMAVQLVALANGFGTRLASLPLWAELNKTATITTVQGTSTYDLPIDWLVPLHGTAWNRSASWPLAGPIAPVHWQTLQSGVGAGATSSYRYRFVGGQVQLHTGAVSTGETLVFDYLSSEWVLGVDGEGLATVGKPRISADNDYILLHEEMFITGLKVAWRAEKGFEYSRHLAEFLQMLEAAWANSSGAAILSFIPNLSQQFLSLRNVPDSGYGS